jgi:hypothetical protein
MHRCIIHNLFKIHIITFFLPFGHLTFEQKDTGFAEKYYFYNKVPEGLASLLDPLTNLREKTQKVKIFSK